ncbi:MAG: vanadium-dependent haloperoxidase [Bacteroidota bacterium]
MRALFAIVFILMSCCAGAQMTGKKGQLPDIRQQVWKLTEVMFHDVVNPPAAARFYAYSLLTGYELYCQLDKTPERLRQKLNNYPDIKITADKSSVNRELVVLYGILETGKTIIPSGFLLEKSQEELVNYFNKELSPETITASVSLAKEVSRQIVQYAATDGYFKLSTKARYKPFNTDSCWKPTPPEYMPAVEPHWRTIRTFFLDSASQFKPQQPQSFDKDSNSAFMKMTMEVYKVGSALTEEQRLIANFWDCNPFAVQFQGHMSIGLKKISPGGHWMCIAGTAAEKAGLDLKNNLLLHTLTALTLHDAFISCWDEKYRSNRLRPEQAINKYIDAKWKPLLQTPPFPEYSSGHSVISTASAEVLTYFLGNDFSFIDSAETYIGLSPRSFPSFREAAAEARISRLYGGIHFRDAIEAGGEQGRKVGEFILQKLELKPFY